MVQFCVDASVTDSEESIDHIQPNDENRQPNAQNPSGALAAYRPMTAPIVRIPLSRRHDPSIVPRLGRIYLRRRLF